MKKYRILKSLNDDFIIEESNWPDNQKDYDDYESTCVYEFGIVYFNTPEQAANKFIENNIKFINSYTRLIKKFSDENDKVRKIFNNF
jgi:hypothetical protein